MPASRTPPAAGHAIRLVEVGPRDGLQNEAVQVPLDLRQALIERLAAAGLRHIEAGAFVSERRVPQMAGSAALLQALGALPGLAGVELPVLTPNLRGYEAARAAGARSVAVFISASEGFSRSNLGCSVAESLHAIDAVMAAAAADGVRVRGYLSCVVACPFDGPTPAAQVAALAEHLLARGCHEVSLGDTIGVGRPDDVRRLLGAVARRVEAQRLAGHFHDTCGMGVANVAAACEFGLRTFDASVAGLGGCPFAPGSSGNVATEDLVYLFDGLPAPGAATRTGVDLAALVKCGQWIAGHLGRPGRSRAGRYLAGVRAPA